MALETQVAVARRSYTVLAVDGGGIRGIIAAAVLQEIEQRTGRRTVELFDLVAGTSTGGIIALGVTKPNRNKEPEYTAKALVDLYRNRGGEIFRKRFTRRVRNIGGLIGVRYPAKGIEAVLNDQFGDAKLSDALTEVVIPAYDLSRPGPFYFKRRYTRDEQKWDVPMASVARATSAAPTYFDPAPLPPFNGEPRHALVDGGVFANNPVVSAYAEALDLWPGEDVDIRVVSIGTGKPPQTQGDSDGIPVSYEQARAWGVARWARPVLHVVFDGVEQTAEWQLKRLCPADDSGTLRYHRLQSPLPTANHALDDASPRNLDRLLADAGTLLEREGSALDEICAQLLDVAVERDASRLAQSAHVQPRLEP
jgi:uncharacterized protein